MNMEGRQKGVQRPAGKISWHGLILSVQPHIRLLRSFDQRNHSYQGYVLQFRGVIADETRDFTVGVGESAHAKHQFQVGDEVSGEGVFVTETRMETAEIYKVSKLRVQKHEAGGKQEPPPWHSLAPELPIYQQRGHRRLDARTYTTKCSTCVWGCKMPVEMTIDHWNPSQKRYREETFCYGPLSCPFYKAGPTRKVPGRKGMSWEEADWVDEQDVSHRGPDSADW